MNKNLEEIYKKNIRDLQEQNRNLMVRVKMLTDELYELKTNKKFYNSLFYDMVGFQILFQDSSSTFK